MGLPLLGSPLVISDPSVPRRVVSCRRGCRPCCRRSAAAAVIDPPSSSLIRRRPCRPCPRGSLAAFEVGCWSQVLGAWHGVHGAGGPWGLWMEVTGWALFNPGDVASTVAVGGGCRLAVVSSMVGCVVEWGGG